MNGGVPQHKSQKKELILATGKASYRLTYVNTLYSQGYTSLQNTLNINMNDIPKYANEKRKKRGRGHDQRDMETSVSTHLS